MTVQRIEVEQADSLNDMHPLKEWLLVAAGGIIGASVGGALGGGAIKIAMWANPFAFFLVLLLWLATLLLVAFGAMLGGEAAGRFIDRNNPRRDD